MATYHARSNSFPSRPHPLLPEFEEQLCRLRASGSASSSNSTSIACQLSGLQDLHDCVDRLLLLPLKQQALSQENNGKWVDQIVDGSLRLLDACSIVKDALSQTKESTQQLQSVIRRRRRGGEVVISSEVKKFLSSRKVVKKAINNATKNLKEMEKRCSFSPLNKDNETVSIVNAMKEAEAITVVVLESLLSFISEPKTGSKPNGWSFISNIKWPKRTEEESKSNEFANAEAALDLLMCQMKKSCENLSVENAQNQLRTLELCIQDLEEGLESLFRCMLKTRVSLLNILNH